MGKTRVRIPKANRTYAVYRVPMFSAPELIAIGLTEREANEHKQALETSYPDQIYKITASPKAAKKVSP